MRRRLGVDINAHAFQSRFMSSRIKAAEQHGSGEALPSASRACSHQCEHRDFPLWFGNQGICGDHSVFFKRHAR